MGQKNLTNCIIGSTCELMNLICVISNISRTMDLVVHRMHVQEMERPLKKIIMFAEVLAVDL